MNMLNTYTLDLKLKSTNWGNYFWTDLSLDFYLVYCVHEIWDLKKKSCIMLLMKEMHYITKLFVFFLLLILE